MVQGFVHEHSLVASRVNEVSAGFIECIEQLEGGLLGHAPIAILLPLVSDAHGTELKG